MFRKYKIVHEDNGYFHIYKRDLFFFWDWVGYGLSKTKAEEKLQKIKNKKKPEVWYY